jgi:hypothetical protein
MGLHRGMLTPEERARIKTALCRELSDRFCMRRKDGKNGHGDGNPPVGEGLLTVQQSGY